MSCNCSQKYFLMFNTLSNAYNACLFPGAWKSTGSPQSIFHVTDDGLKNLKNVSLSKHNILVKNRTPIENPPPLEEILVLRRTYHHNKNVALEKRTTMVIRAPKEYSGLLNKALGGIHKPCGQFGCSKVAEKYPKSSYIVVKN